MAALPSYLLDKPHLPLAVGLGIAGVVTRVDAVYGLKMNADDYKPVQAYRGSNGLIQFDLLNKEGELLTQFVDKASGAAVVEALAGNDVTVTFGSVNDTNWLAKSVLVYDASQLNVFKQFSSGYVYDAMETRNDLGYTLSKLLNLYTETPVWMHSSFADYSTAKFTVVFQGESVDAPAEFNLANDSTYTVIIQIQSGQHQGLICFLAPQ